ncbi:MAG TPA: glycosyltransferase family 4 protein [Gemmatimonadales bacterium]|nr:glycosyltransferase family 4 protein [Gemmatimonadales bacterium]
MRVVFVTHNYPRHAGDLSGSFLATLAEALVRRGHVVSVVAPSDAGQGGDAELNGVRVRRVRYASPRRETIAYKGTMLSALRGPAGWIALGGLWRALRRGVRRELEAGAELIHAHWWVPAGLAIPAGAPAVLTVHGTDAALLRRSALARGVAAPVFRRARVVTTVSKELAGWVQAAVHRFVPREHVQPMPVESTSWPWTAGGAGAVVIARLTAQKRVQLAIEAVACLVELGRPLPLTIVGDGPERSALEALAGRLGVASLVRFEGAVAPERVPEYLARADLMLFPAKGEGFGLAAAEALMAGVPAVGCWDGGGVLDVIPEKGAGRLTLPSGEALADAALDILNDPRRLELGRAEGESWRHRLSPDHVAAVAEGWYREALPTPTPAAESDDA